MLLDNLIYDYENCKWPLNASALYELKPTSIDWIVTLLSFKIDADVV